MSGTIANTFRYGPLRGWELTLSYTWADNGELAAARATLEARPAAHSVWGGLLVAALPSGSFVDGYDLVRDAVINGGHDRQMRVAEWMIDTMREAVEHRDDLPERARTLWRQLVELADEAHADWHGRFGDLDPDTAVRVETHPFQVVRTLIFDRLTGALA